MSALAIWHLIAERAFSSILTLSVMLQCLGVVLLALQVLATGRASGISAKALMLDALALGCRLSSTMWLNGYLPVDATGDYVFQFFDICSLVIILWLLHQILVVRRQSYNESADSFHVGYAVAGAFILACLLHGNMNRRPIFDALWMVALFISAIAVLPQLWLITRTNGRCEALTSHHIAAMAASRILSGLFMWYARSDITCSPGRITNFNYALGAIIGAHIVHVILLGDFTYYYIKAVLKEGLNCCVEVPLLADKV